MSNEKKATKKGAAFGGVLVKSQQDLVLTKSPDFAMHYANNTGLVTTTFDLSLLFGRIIDIGGGKVTVEQFAQITMSYQHAKAVSEILTDHLRKYEEKHGEIKGKAVSLAKPNGGTKS